ncbi:Spc97 / Spc98 family protein [Brugia pahangi]
MYRNDTLQLGGDSIWGRITLLLSSLIGRPCTGLERAQFYEVILLKSLEKQEEEIPLQSMIDQAVVLLSKEDDGYQAKKFISLIGKLRETADSSEEIIRFLLLLSRIGNNYGDKNESNTLPYCSGSEILNIWKQTVNNHLPISKNYSVTSTKPFIDRTNEQLVTCQSHYEHKKEVVDQYQLRISKEKTAQIDTIRPRSSESYEKIRRMIVDERGRIHPRACDPELRSLCNLSIGDVFFRISWREYLRCLLHMLMGEESFLFCRSANGFFSISEENKIFLELEDVNLLPRLALPFLNFANRLFSLEQFLRNSDSVKDSSMLNYKIQEGTATRALLSLKLCVTEQLWKFRDEVRHYVDSKKECDSESIRRLLRELLDMCNVFNYFVDIILYIQITAVQNVNTLLDIFYIVKITKGRKLPVIREFCDDVIVVLLRYYAECILFWLMKGEANPCDGVFSFSEKNTEILQWAVAGINGSINLEASLIITKNFVDVWLFEGKFRKIILAWPNLEQMIPEESNCLTINKLMVELSEEKIRKALSSDLLGAVGSLLDFYFQKIYLSQCATFARCCIIDDFKQTLKLLQDVYLCNDECITEIFVSILLNKEDGSELNSTSGSYQNCQLDEMVNYLLARNYSSNLVQGFLEAKNSFDEKDAMKLHYKPPFPLNVIFAPSVLVDYLRIRTLLLRITVECTALEEMMVQKVRIYSIALMQMRMWNFVRAMRCFFHDQIRYIVVNEFQNDLDGIKTIAEASQLHQELVKKLYRRCLLGQKHVMLWNVLDDCLALITRYRHSAKSFNILTLFKIFDDFHNNVDLFCNAVKMTSVGANYWLSDLLLLTDFTSIYIDFHESS